jgi:uncharacterized membrane protein
MDIIGRFHFAVAIVALLSGAVVLVRRKGTRSHRRAGWLYVVSMLALNTSALMLYQLTGSFTPFHAAALLSLVSVIGGVMAARRRRSFSGWAPAHYFWMSFSYVGLVAAAASETITRVDGIDFWGGVGVASLSIFILGGAIVFARATPSLARYARPARSRDVASVQG